MRGSAAKRRVERSDFETKLGIGERGAELVGVEEKRQMLSWTLGVSRKTSREEMPISRLWLIFLFVMEDFLHFFFSFALPPTLEDFGWQLGQSQLVSRFRQN